MDHKNKLEALNKEALQKADFIDIVNSKAEFLDPAFEFWFRKNFLKKAIGH